MTRAVALVLLALTILTVRAGVDPAWVAVFTVAAGVGTAWWAVWSYRADPPQWEPPALWSGRFG